MAQATLYLKPLMPTEASLPDQLHDFCGPFNRQLLALAPDGPSQRLNDAIAYALEGDGKRLRPFLTMVIARHYGAHEQTAMAAGLALELIHTYSLIHDDLPAMDDDDLRRGRPTLHRQFDEATAILAGDAMQSMAFSLLAMEQSADPNIRMRMVAELARAAGPHGICAGQDLDLAGLNNAHNHQDVLAIAKHKTAAMFRASCVLGGLAAGLGSPTLEKYEAFGESLGILFQLRDDMLDETGDEQMMGKKAGKDRDAGKATIWSVDDSTSSQEVLSLAHRETLALLGHIDDRPPLLQTICDFVMARSH